MARWAWDLENALQKELSGMCRTRSDSIKSRPNRLCLESVIFPGTVLSSISIVAGNPPVMGITSLYALRAICLRGVRGVWLMIFHCLCEMRVMSEAMSICNWTERPFSFTDTYFRFDLVFGKKDCHQTVCMFFFAVCVCLSLVCYLQNPSLCPCFLNLRQQPVLNGLFWAKCQPPQFQSADGGFLCVDNVGFCCFWTAWTEGVIAGTDWCTMCESCLRFTNRWRSIATYCRVMSGSCSTFEKFSFEPQHHLWTSICIQISDT